MNFIPYIEFQREAKRLKKKYPSLPTLLFRITAYLQCENLDSEQKKYAKSCFEPLAYFILSD